jgi:hypothetical protein
MATACGTKFLTLVGNEGKSIVIFGPKENWIDAFKGAARFVRGFALIFYEE